MSFSRERGQLLLIGAVVLAGTILGIGMVLYGPVASDPTATDETEPATDVDEHDRVLGTAVERIADDAWNESESAFETDLENDIDEFLERYQRVVTGGAEVVSTEAELVDANGDGTANTITLTVRYATDDFTIERTLDISPTDGSAAENEGNEAGESE